MRKEYEEVFLSLYEAFRGTAADHDYQRIFGEQDELLIRSIKESMDRAAGETRTNKALRSDARYFILVNMYSMVLLPLRGRVGRGPLPGIGTEDMFIDITQIIQAAALVSEGREITGNDVLAGTAIVRNQLRLNRLEVWG